MKVNRRQLIQAGLSLAGSSLLPAIGRGQAAAAGRGPSSAGAGSSFLDLVRPPTRVELRTGAGAQPLAGAAGGRWHWSDVEVQTVAEGDLLRISVSAPRTPLERIALRWNAAAAPDLEVLGDHWERSYADLAWKSLDPARVLPWYFLTFDGQQTHGYGVRTEPGALLYFGLDSAGVTLVADLRCGGVAVRLGDRSLAVASLTTRRGGGEESPFAAARAFCRQMCPNPRLPSAPVFGINDWYYAYGKNS
ncbi:MAG TPA: hypothetical protein VGV61_09470, partial [Thermoanaerobaculia bacterium]|nr:hypothetical protein [Thermoanaerobaculia bacterium]